ncbi:MAG TPA: amino acid-binding protein [Propionibacteriaceae bacterium]|nr:amino acid-binding protein [Propionibacteriaceae bacterium]
MMRVRLPDRPGSLGAVATAMGTADGDIHAVEIVEKGEGYAVDDFIVNLPNGKLPETIVTACHHLPGVRVEWISRYPEGGGLQSDLEALERMTADPSHAAETLVTLAPVVFRSQWAILVQVRGEQIETVFWTPLAPTFTADTLRRLGPYDAAHRVDLEDGWIPGWADSTVVVTPLTQDRVIAIGRLGGPRFLDSEIARLHHLAALVK